MAEQSEEKSGWKIWEVFTQSKTGESGAKRVYGPRKRAETPSGFPF